MNRRNAYTTICCLLVATGCATPEEIFCLKAGECKDRGGLTLEQCIQRMEQFGTAGQRARCAECIDAASCTEIAAGVCASACQGLE